MFNTAHLFEAKENFVKIALISLHGLIRETNLELGRDADTGGQIVYVLELAKALSLRKEVEHVYLFTRKIQSKHVSQDYSKDIEDVQKKFSIIRIPFGPKRYLHKESLWPYLTAFVDNTLHWLRENRLFPDIIHGHYADAGWASMYLASILGKPHIFTAHSLGYVKKLGLISGKMPIEEIEKRYRISTRIEAEEVALDHASMVIASTHDEKQKQYALYDHYNPRYIQVIAPGINLKRFHPKLTSSCLKPPVWMKIARFLHKPQLPMILSVCRPDYKKNIKTLVRVFGKSKRLQEKANLVVFLGVREDIRKLAQNPREVLKELLLDIDTHDLYGKIAYPQKHEAEDIPDIYRLAAKSRGVFVHPALEENFGLTLLEAASCGLPIVATKIGGPRTILKDCENGFLIDPLNEEEMEEAIYKVLTSNSQWKTWSKNGIRNVHKLYSWEAHVKRYLDAIKIKKQAPLAGKKHPWANMIHFDRLLICDIDNTLIGNRHSLRKLFKMLANSKVKVGFGVATGRNLELIKEVLRDWNIPSPNLLISSVGSEIYYGQNPQVDTEWQRWLNYRWQAQKVREILKKEKGLTLQPEHCQNPYKVSYFIDENANLTTKDIKKKLRQENISCNVIHSHGSLLDILPVRCSKGLALRYFINKWKLSSSNVLVAGDSGNDISMLRGEVLGVVVANYSPEVETLRHEPRIFFAPGKFAQGIIDAIEHYHFLGDIQVPPQEELITSGLDKHAMEG